MRVVVADTSPLNYLVLIGQIESLPALFEKVFAPQIVQNELRHDDAPLSVRRWIAEPPSWLEIAPDQNNGASDLWRLDDGERAAILLAIRMGADLLLMDDRDGVVLARRRGFAVTGTLGILDLAAGRGLIRLGDAIARLKNTSFRCHPTSWLRCWPDTPRSDSRFPLRIPRHITRPPRDLSRSEPADALPQSGGRPRRRSFCRLRWRGLG